MNGAGAVGGAVAGIVVLVSSYGVLCAVAVIPLVALGVAVATPACRVAFEHPFDIDSRHDSDAGTRAQGARVAVDCQTGTVGSPHHPPSHRGDTMASAANDREKALDAALAQIERQFGKGSIMRLGEEGRIADRGDPHRLDRARHRPRHRRPAARPHRGDLRPGVLRQDHPRPARHRERAGGRRPGRVHRRRARPRPRLRLAAGHRPRQPLRLPARHRRAGPGDLRHARPLGRHRPHRHRLGGGARAPRRDRGRDGRLATSACRPA